MNVSDIKVEWPVKSCKIIVTVIESSNVSLRNEKKKKKEETSSCSSSDQE